MGEWIYLWDYVGLSKMVDKVTDFTSDWKTAPDDVSSAGPGDGSVWPEPDFDPFQPPGILTSRGSNLSIDSKGQFYVGHGSRAVVLDLPPLQWQLFSTALAKLRAGMQQGSCLLMLEGGELVVRKNRLSFIELRVKQRLGSALTVTLNAREADDLHRAARSRSILTTDKEQA